MSSQGHRTDCRRQEVSARKSGRTRKQFQHQQVKFAFISNDVLSYFYLHFVLSFTRPYIPPSAREGATNTAGKRDPYGRGYDEVPAIRIENLSESTSEADLSELVSRFGQIARIYLASNKVTGVCKGYAFVNFKSKMDAERAIKGLHGYGYDHLILNVDWSTNNHKSGV